MELHVVEADLGDRWRGRPCPPGTLTAGRLGGSTPPSPMSQRTIRTRRGPWIDPGRRIARCAMCTIQDAENNRVVAGDPWRVQPATRPGYRRGPRSRPRRGRESTPAGGRRVVFPTVAPRRVPREYDGGGPEPGPRRTPRGPGLAVGRAESSLRRATREYDGGGPEPGPRRTPRGPGPAVGRAESYLRRVPREYDGGGPEPRPPGRERKSDCEAPREPRPTEAEPEPVRPSRLRGEAVSLRAGRGLESLR
jgi:hypothetical protein